MNRLASEASPYLRQHADNPVDWYPWGEEALAKAKAEGKPIFLSVGYSTCHWCHVMERESFENEAVAAILNKYFISIKVDRESRPDIDETYMLATQLLTRRGGWPNSVFMTPEGEPFYAGTYFPPDIFMKILNAVAEQWSDNRQELMRVSKNLSKVISDYHSRRMKAAELTPEVFSGAVKTILKTHDDIQGGFGQAPKFPHEPALLYLLHRAEREGDMDALKAASFSLQEMAKGGIHDQAGGGFHRYSTDNEWLTPHFEKMLYNQAQLARAYAKAYSLTGRADFARVARRILDYVLDDLRSKNGGFYSARDADSGGGEGLFYLWTRDELRKLLGKVEAEFVIDVFNVSRQGNFEGSNILHLKEPLEGETAAKADKILSLMVKERARREPPHRDEKIITAWNGMMITAFAEAGDILDDKRYLDAASEAAELLWRQSRKKDGSLWRILFEGKPGVEGQQEDYAYYAQGLIALHDANADDIWLQRAQKITDAMIVRFLDIEAGDFFLTRQKGKIARAKLRNDGAISSGNSVALEVLSKLGRRTDNADYALKAESLAAALSGLAAESPDGHAYALRGADALLGGEAGKLQYAGKGAVRGEAVFTDRNEIEIILKIRSGWHVNANKPLSKDFIPTTVEIKTPEGWKAGEPVYPKPVKRKLRFSDAPLALYEKEAIIRIPLSMTAEKKAGERFEIKLTTQVCSDEICLEPEKTAFALHVM